MAVLSQSQSDSPPVLASLAEQVGAGVVIPAYNPGIELGTLLRDLAMILGKDRVLVVDDGSILGDFAPYELAGHHILHVAHGGKGWALRQGFESARERGWQWAITMDADGQHAPSDLRAFLLAIQNDAGDILLGNRMDDTRRMPWLRRMTNITTSQVISRLARQWIPDAQSGYRAIRLSLLDAFPLVTQNFDTESEILLRAAWAGYRITPIPIQTIYRGDEPSHIKKFRDTMRFLRLMHNARRWRRA